MRFIVGILLIVSQMGVLGASHEASGVRDMRSTPEETWPSTESHRPRSAIALHDYHISNFEIEYNAETNALEIIAKIFIDDMEDGNANSGVEEKL